MNDLHGKTIGIIIGLGIAAMIGIVLLSRIPSTPPLRPQGASDTSDTNQLSPSQAGAPNESIASATPHTPPPGGVASSSFRGPDTAPKMKGPSAPPPNY
jgi:hypothetical protein